MPGPFNLDHLHPIKALLVLTFSNFFTFILGGQFFLPQSETLGKASQLMSVICAPHPRKIQRWMEGDGEGDLLIHSCQIYYLG